MHSGIHSLGVIPTKAGTSVYELFNPSLEALMGTFDRYCVYILASRKYGPLYIGVTGDLVRRVYTHREKILQGFTSKYNVHQLVHFEQFSAPQDAIAREKQLKKWRRAWKIELIEKGNPEWRDLWVDIAHRNGGPRFRGDDPVENGNYVGIRVFY
jgi:putative endonuclease